jgi:carbonic anhydrase
MKKVGQSTIFAILVSSFALISMSPLLFAEQGAPHWSYEGEEGPEHWGELADEYMMCSRGLNQSPINLVADLHADLPQLVFDYYS